MKILPLFEELSDEFENVYQEGKKIFPKLSIRKVNGVKRFFLNYPKNKGSFSLNSFKKEIVRQKIKKIYTWLNEKRLVKKINWSQTTLSIYFKFKDKNIRISDHKKNSFEGVDILIKWDTTGVEIANIFKSISEHFSFNPELLHETEDIDWDLYEILDEARTSVMSQFLEAIEKEKPSDEKPLKARQPWTRISFSALKRQWEEYMKFGYVKPNYEKTILEFEKIFIENTFKLTINTELAGHDTINPIEEWKEYLDGTNYDNENLDEFVEYLDFWFGDYITEEHGQLRISDFGLPKLNKLILELRKTHDVSKKLPILDRMLNVIHMRSDIAEWFVEGGSRALSQLSGEIK